MSGSNFVDYVKIFARSGAGGAGAVSFRREKFVEFGGPDGGDGGRGGHVILKGNSQRWTLLHLRYQRHLFAKSGGHGGGAKCTGANGEDIYVEVPLGVVIRNADTNEVVGQITQDGEEFILCEGGQGGQGNWHFRTATNQAPRYAQPGGEMQEGTFIIELKLLADVGLVGFPNAGKSTLLSVMSAAKPKIADYPFTTLEPNLGVVEYRDFKTFVIADIPGIIEGAAEGKGMGTRFLRHIERNSVLLFMIAADSMNIKDEYEILLSELRQHNPDMLEKKRILAITKSDMLDKELMDQMRETLPDTVPHIFISSVTEYNIPQLKDLLWKTINEE